MNRLVLRTLLIVAIVGMPMSCVTGWTVVYIASPMIMNFWTGFSVRNSAGEIIYVTPIGTVGREGYRDRLPLSRSSHFSIPPSTNSDFRLSPNEVRRFIYNWDDINFSELAVRDERGHWRQLVVDPHPTERQYRRLAQDFFVIPPFSELPDATEAVRAAAVRPGSPTSIPWLLSLLGIFPPLLLVFCVWRLGLFHSGPSPREG